MSSRPAIVFVFTDAVLTIVLGSSLGFLGLGVQPPQAEWGVMIAEGQLYLADAWWISVFPGHIDFTIGARLSR